MRDPSLDGLAREDEGGAGGTGAPELSQAGVVGTPFPCIPAAVCLEKCWGAGWLGSPPQSRPARRDLGAAERGLGGSSGRPEARGPRPERRLRADAVPGGLGGPHESALRTGRTPAGSPFRAEGPQMAFVHRSLRFVCFQTEVTTFNSDEKSFLKIVIAGKKKKIVTILGIKF